MRWGPRRAFPLDTGHDVELKGFGPVQVFELVKNPSLGAWPGTRVAVSSR